MTTANEKDAIQRRDEALEVARQFGNIRGSHHQAWVIDQMCRVLLGNEYPSWVADTAANREPASWDTGIAPNSDGACHSTLERSDTTTSGSAVRAAVLSVASTAIAKDHTLHLEQCVAVKGQPGCTCRQIENAVMRDQLKTVFDQIPRQPQRQDSTNQQLLDLHAFADRLGLYDAADAIKNMVGRAK
ncbi:hypothetical protein NPS53_09485 [Pseudomonas putida]|uniref:hypothetical protein n=1 Tax=Pseudomonas putida TaxID=303 RepID=UPI00236456FE|nr:hypothetical protein [Pseudomonas putida]MDD2139809.1 hypothetical protein [Pseudomonas putida]HDS1721733.1 hypothetical protein [Pseudomonas putida]